MDKVFKESRTVKKVLIMRKFKPANSMKPYRHFQSSQGSWEDEQSCSESYSSNSRDVQYTNYDRADGRKAGHYYGHQNRSNAPQYRKGFNRNRGSFRAISEANRSYHMKASVEKDQESTPSVSGEQKSRTKCPPHLKGKEIGLWFSRQKKLKDTKEQDGIFSNASVYIGPEIRGYLEEVLNSVEASHFANDDLLDKGIEEEYRTFEERINETEHIQREQSNELDRKLYEEHLNKSNSPQYKKIFKFRENLPTFKMRDEIIELIEQNQVLIISGGTGCGKSTQVVQYVLDHYIENMKGSLCNIICTQPRRISAVSLADRVAYERCEPFGTSVGYNIRFESALASRETACINYMTTGILLAVLETQPTLGTVSHLFLDEIHERNVDSDLMMGLLKYILPKRPDLKVILMSATSNENVFSSYFSGAPIVYIPGRIYPVEELFLEDILQKVNFEFEPTKKISKEYFSYVLPYLRDMEEKKLYPKSVLTKLANPKSEELNLFLITKIVEYICLNEKDGSMLVFLPGIAEITHLQKMIMQSNWYSPDRYIIVPMHSILSTAQQKDAFLIPPPGVRKIIIASPIMETSVTVDDICYVVDCGKKKCSAYDIKMKVATLEPSWISLANASQRKGRAGRTRPGKCYKVYTKIRQECFDKFPIPECLSMSLEDVILKAKLLGLGDVTPFLLKLLDPPRPEIIELSLKLLRNLDVLDNEERLTPLGYQLAKLPLHPRVGKMILMGALFSCLEPILSIAACLSFKDPFVLPIGKEDLVLRVKEYFASGEKSDHFIYSEALRHWKENNSMGEGGVFAYDNFLSPQTVLLLSEVKKQIGKILYWMNFVPTADITAAVNNFNSDNVALLKAIMCSGLYPNVAVLKKKSGKSLSTTDHKSVHFHMRSYLKNITDFESPFFVYHVIMRSTSIFIHDATMIYPMPLLFFGEMLEMREQGNKLYLQVDEKIAMESNKETGLLIKSLRNHLNSILKRAISHPEDFHWPNGNEKTKILVAIIKLLSSERIIPCRENDGSKSMYCISQTN